VNKNYYKQWGNSSIWRWEKIWTLYRRCCATNPCYLVG